MKMGILGLPSSGKSTVFGILSGEDAAGAVTRPDKPRVAMVKVPDPRIDWLSALYKPKKTIYTDVEFVDFAAIRAGGSPGEAFPPAFLSILRTMDGLLMTVRLFEDENVFHPEGSLDAARDVALMDTEFILADLQVAESRLDRLTKNVARGLKDDAKEQALMERVKTHLENEAPLSTLELKPDELALLRNYSFLTLKPAVILLNLDDAGFRRAADEVAKLADVARGRPVLPLSAVMEEEISRLDPDDQKVFLEDLGLTEPARARLIRQCHDLLGLICFFTVGEDEVRAWTLRRGEPAVKAAGRIHSDLERGFIRAEIFGYEDLHRLGDVPTVKKEGLWRLEGKEYVVRDGDIVCIRHNQ